MGILLVLTLFLAVGGTLAAIGARYRATAQTLADRIDTLLPQTQCGRCGFPACRPYAEAIAEGTADIDRCPPGGDEGIRSLARLLGVPPKPLNPAHGTISEKRVAVIREDQCIGCALCLKACPVDAIVGAPQWMHTVIASECTGCELCVNPCPVDCIEMRPAEVARSSLACESPDRAAIIGTPGGHPRSGPNHRLPDSREPVPCIRCGFCEDACPEHLAPQRLLAMLKRDDHTGASASGLFDCTECRLCDQTCPIHIPLTPTFRAAKSAILAWRGVRAEAEHAWQRYEARGHRLERERQRRDDQAVRQRTALAKPGADAIAASIERVRMRKAAIRSGPNRTVPGDGFDDAPDGSP